MPLIKCDLVVPPSRDDTVAVSRAGFFSPLGLLSLVTFALQYFPELDVQIWDGNIIPEHQILTRNDAKIVGFSPTILSYESCLRLARLAKANGSTVVFGGYHATSLGKRVLEASDFVDYVISGDGEGPFTELLKCSNPADIPNLIYRTDCGIRVNPAQRMPLDAYPFADRTLLDRHEYIRRFQNKYSSRIQNSRSHLLTKRLHVGC